MKILVHETDILEGIFYYYRGCQSVHYDPKVRLMQLGRRLEGSEELVQSLEYLGRAGDKTTVRNHRKLCSDEIID